MRQLCTPHGVVVASSGASLFRGSIIRRGRESEMSKLTGERDGVTQKIAATLLSPSSSRILPPIVPFLSIREKFRARRWMCKHTAVRERVKVISIGRLLFLSPARFTQSLLSRGMSLNCAKSDSRRRGTKNL